MVSETNITNNIVYAVRNKVTLKFWGVWEINTLDQSQSIECYTYFIRIHIGPLSVVNPVVSNLCLLASFFSFCCHFEILFSFLICTLSLYIYTFITLSITTSQKLVFPFFFLRFSFSYALSLSLPPPLFL